MQVKNLFIQKLIIGLAAMQLCIVVIFSCGPGKNSSQNSMDGDEISRHSNIKYAIGFDLVDHENFKLLDLIRHYDHSADTSSFVLYEKGAEIPEKFSAMSQIQIPAQQIALLHSSYISLFEFCNSKDHIKAISESKYIYDSAIYSSIINGKIKEVGYGETLDKERLLALDISVVVTVGFPNAPNKSQQLLKELGIPVLVFSDWQETSLLGRAEWVKVIAALTGKEKFVKEKFVQLETQYNSLTSLTSGLEDLPKVICNLPFKGTWFVPGGDSYISHLLQDSGADYLWANEQGTGGIPLDLETVYAGGINADYWINPGFAASIEDITDIEERLIDFKPLKSSNIYNNNLRVARGMANDYWESGIMSPQLILADLIHIFHPELLPTHQLYFYQQIN